MPDMDIWAFFAPISALPNCKKTYFEIPTH